MIKQLPCSIKLWELWRGREMPHPPCKPTPYMKPCCLHLNFKVKKLEFKNALNKKWHVLHVREFLYQSECYNIHVHVQITQVCKLHSTN